MMRQDCLDFVVAVVEVMCYGSNQATMPLSTMNPAVRNYSSLSVSSLHTFSISPAHKNTADLTASRRLLEGFGRHERIQRNKSDSWAEGTAIAGT